MELYSLTYNSHDQNRILSRIWALARVISLEYKSRYGLPQETIASENIIMSYIDVDVVKNMNMFLSNTPANFDFNFSDMIQINVKAYHNINVYNYFVTFDGGSVDSKNLNTITIVMSVHKSKNTHMLSTGEIISPTIDMSFFLPEMPEKRKVFGNFQTITTFKLSRSQLFL